MNLVNRGFIFVRPSKPFIDWAKEIDTDLVMDENAEGSIYLIEEEFWDDELILKQMPKKLQVRNSVASLKTIPFGPSGLTSLNLRRYLALRWVAPALTY